MTNIDQLYNEWCRTQLMPDTPSQSRKAFARFVLESLAPSKHSELNAFLLVNFLRLPPEHKAHLIQSIMEKGGGEYLWKPYPENKPTEPGYCAVRTTDANSKNGWRRGWWTGGEWQGVEHVVAFMEIPEFKSTKA